MATTLKRAAFLASTGAFAAAPSIARSQTLTPLRIAGSADEDIVGTLWGIQSGIFQKYGLDVSVQRLNSGSIVSAALLGGTIDIGKSSSFGLVLGHVKGVPFVIEAGASNYATETPTAGLVVAREGPIRSARDLNGKTVAVPALGDLFTTATLGWVDDNGGDSRSLKFVEMPLLAAAEAVAAGRVAACNLIIPNLTDSINSGKCRLLGYAFDSFAKHFNFTFYFTTADFAAKNADTLARFRKALAESVAYVIGHQAESAPLVAKFTGGDVKTAATMRVVLATSLQPALLQPVIEAAVKYKAIPKSFPAKEMFDPAIVLR
jgi:NitT/TauT family transport system substrate-binding protein